MRLTPENPRLEVLEKLHIHKNTEKQAVMSSDAMIPVRLLQINQKSFTIRLRPLRVGSELTCGRTNSFKIRKLIMIDDEGVQIGAIIFNDDIDYFKETFFLDKTYQISNGEVKSVNSSFPTAHPEKELVLKRYTIIKEAVQAIGDNVHYDFKKFEHIDSQLHKNDKIDIYGVVTKVKECKIIQLRGAQKPLREITVINKEYQPIVVCLWEDMAINEGTTLQEIVDKHPIIAITKLTATEYLGELQLQTTAASILQIAPTCQEIEDIHQWLCTIHAPMKISEMSMIQRIRGATEVMLEEIILNRSALSENKYYCIKGMVDKVENKSYIWYDSCKRCATSIYKNEENSACNKCGEQEVETKPRYRLVLNVVQGHHSACITIFEEAASVYVGCPVEEYIASTEQGEHESKYYRELSSQASTEVRFLIPLNTRTQVVNGKLNAVADAIQKVHPLSRDEKKKFPTKSTKSTQMKNILPKEKSDAPTDIKRRDATVSKHENKKRTIIKKDGKDGCEIQISSDDEVTLHKLKKKCAKKTVDSRQAMASTTIKIKKEKN